MTGRAGRVAVSGLRRVKPVFVRLIGSSLQVVLSVLVARWGGAAVLGSFLVFVALTQLAISVGSGLPNLLIRHASTDDPGDPHTGWLWRSSLTLTLVCLVVAAVALPFGGHYVTWVAGAVAALLVQRISSSAVTAMGRPALGVLLDTALWPFVVVLLAVLWTRDGAHLTFGVLVLGYLCGLVLAAGVAVAVSRHAAGSIATSWRAPWRTPRSFYAELGLVTVGAVASMVSANAALSLAPVFLTDAEAGRLGLALRIAGFATTILVALAAHFSPLYARARTQRELYTYRRQSQLACLALYLPVLLAAVLLPTSWLRDVLGDDFTGVKPLVVVLAVGYLLNAATGLTPHLILMRGRSRDYSLVGTVGAVLTVTGVVLGGWLGGEVGLCVGISAAMVLVNLWGFAVSTRAIRDAPVEAPPERAAQPIR